MQYSLIGTTHPRPAYTYKGKGKGQDWPFKGETGPQGGDIERGRREHILLRVVITTLQRELLDRLDHALPERARSSPGN